MPTVGDVLLDARLRQRLDMAQAKSSIRGVSVTTNGVLAALWNFADRFPDFRRKCTFHTPMPATGVIEDMCVRPYVHIGG